MNEEYLKLREQLRAFLKVLKEHGTIVPSDRIKTEVIDAGDVED
jgi:hypothetical protein